MRWLISPITVAALVGADPYKPTPAEMRLIDARAAQLGSLLKKLERDPLYADVAVYKKAADWIRRFPEEFYSKEYLTNTISGLERGIARATDLAAGKAAWPKQTGRLSRAYVSRVDGSIQPYGLVIPDSYSGKHPVRLDVVLHGRAATMNEVSFLAGHDATRPILPSQQHIQLDIYGRTNVSYRWSGETDVWEAIESVRARYNIDPKRIVLRGFSMGGAGAWHLGLHYPDHWAAVEAGAGYTETKRYAKKPDLPPYQDAAVHIYDAVDYALNAFNLPMVGYGGELDAQLQASVNIREQLEREGLRLPDLRMLFLVGPKMGHKWHPDSQKESDAFIDAALAKGLEAPGRLRFVTYTTKYNHCFWITVEGLEKHYARAEVDSRRENKITTVRTQNVASISIGAKGPIELDGAPFPRGGIFRKEGGRWQSGAIPGLRKVQGLQGPIDDAFTDSFLCVRPAGKVFPELDRFTAEFAKWLRGDPRVKDDRSVTAEDIAGHHLVLFGDPWSNAMIAKVIGKLPIKWTRQEITIAGRTFDAASHVPALIYPNPLNPKKYVVINSGHTWDEEAFKGTNALLFPRLGDYGVISTDSGAIVHSGYFNESWR